MVGFLPHVMYRVYHIPYTLCYRIYTICYIRCHISLRGPPAANLEADLACPAEHELEGLRVDGVSRGLHSQVGKHSVTPLVET